MRKSGKLLCKIMPNLIVGLGAAMPAFAESFPSNGLMLENKTYTKAATEENMGVYDGTVTATAEYEDILYQIIGGTYLPAGATVAEQCPANSYCPGVTDATYNASESQGATSCPSGYPNSAMGSSHASQCYTACTLKSANIEHASAVSGNDYYGDGADTCFATACENGYHVYEAVKLIEQPPLIDVDYTMGVKDYGYLSADGGQTRNADTYGLTESTWAIELDAGVVYGRASCQTSHFTVLDYLNSNYNAIMAGTMSPDQVRSDLTPIVGAVKANYVADFVAGLVDGTAGEEKIIEVATVFSLAKDASFSTSDTGKYCYCQITGFQSAPSGESGYDMSKAVAVESDQWVYTIDYSSADQCAFRCAHRCVGDGLVLEGVDYPKLLFGEIRVTDVSTCDANEITIKWTDATDEDIAANNAGMCTYGGDIRTPVRAATKPGKTFIGWKILPQAN